MLSICIMLSFMLLPVWKEKVHKIGMQNTWLRIKEITLPESLSVLLPVFWYTSSDAPKIPIHPLYLIYYWWYWWWSHIASCNASLSVCKPIHHRVACLKGIILSDWQGKWNKKVYLPAQLTCMEKSKHFGIHLAVCIAFRVEHENPKPNWSYLTR